jgi:hypothetical protein
MLGLEGPKKSHVEHMAATFAIVTEKGEEAGEMMLIDWSVLLVTVSEEIEGGISGHRGRLST